MDRSGPGRFFSLLKMTSANDTLFEDTTGHAADLFESIEEDGLTAATDLVTLPEADWDADIAGWGGEQLLAIEMLAAAAGQPSASPGCHYIREWGENNPTELTPSVVKTMLAIVDRVMEMMEAEPEIFHLEASDVPPMLDAGGLMRERIEGI